MTFCKTKWPSTTEQSVWTFNPFHSSLWRVVNINVRKKHLRIRTVQISFETDLYASFINVLRFMCWHFKAFSLGGPFRKVVTSINPNCDIMWRGSPANRLTITTRAVQNTCCISVQIENSFYVYVKCLL